MTTDVSLLPIAFIEAPQVSLKQRITIERVNLPWAQWVARQYHYMHREIHPRAHPFAYRILFDGAAARPDGHPCGMVMFATVHFTKQKELFGYDGMLDKWQVLVLSRMWLHDDLPRNSETCAMGKIWKQIQRDWLTHHPPVNNEKPYHIRLIVSWSDLGAGHDGCVYRAANFKEIKRTVSQPRHGKGNTRRGGGLNLIQYAYWLPEPRWKYEQGKLF